MFNYKTIAVYTSFTPSFENIPEFSYVLEEKLAAMKAAGKTDNIPVRGPNELTVLRFWDTEASAQEWKTFFEQEAVKFNFGVESITIAAA